MLGLRKIFVRFNSDLSKNTKCKTGPDNHKADRQEKEKPPETALAYNILAKQVTTPSLSTPHMETLFIAELLLDHLYTLNPIIAPHALFANNCKPVQ